MLSEEELIQRCERKIEWAKENERFKFFIPNGGQERFIHQLGYYRPFVQIFSAANGVGKTALAANITANIFFGADNERFRQFDLFKQWPYPKRARYITDSKLVEEIGPWHSEVMTWWPRGKYSASKGGKQWFSVYKTKDWLLDVMTYDQAVKDFEGATLGLAIFDEPPPEPIWNATVSRLRKGGLILVFMTPLTSAAWFFDRVVPKHQNAIVYADMEDNCATHGKNGQLKHDDIMRMINEMPPDEVEARAHGKALALAHLIYKRFDPRIHVTKDPILPPPSAQIWQVVDPHIDKPYAVHWGYPDPRGGYNIFAEWPTEDFTIMHSAQEGLKEMKAIFDEREKGLSIEKRVIDRHFAQVRNRMNKKTLFEEMEEIGLTYEPSYAVGPEEEEVQTGILKVREYLAYNMDRQLDSSNMPKLSISPTCTNTIKAMTRWSTDPKTGKPLDNIYKDFCDLVRYAVMANPTIVHVPMRREAKRIFG